MGEVADADIRSRPEASLLRSIAVGVALGVLAYPILLGLVWTMWVIAADVDDGLHLRAAAWAVAAMGMLAAIPIGRRVVLRYRPTWRRPALLAGMTVGAVFGVVLYVAAFVAFGSPWNW